MTDTLRNFIATTTADVDDLPVLFVRDIYADVTRACIVAGNPTAAYIYARLCAMTVRSFR